LCVFILSSPSSSHTPVIFPLEFARALCRVFCLLLITSRLTNERISCVFDCLCACCCCCCCCCCSIEQFSPARMTAERPASSGDVVRASPAGERTEVPVGRGSVADRRGLFESGCSGCFFSFSIFFFFKIDGKNFFLYIFIYHPHSPASPCRTPSRRRRCSHRPRAGPWRIARACLRPRHRGPVLEILFFLIFFKFGKLTSFFFFCGFFFFFFFLSILPAWVSSDDAAPKSPSLAPPAATGARGSVADRKGMFEAKAAYVKLCVFFVMFLFHRPSAHSFIFGP
jgi:hypothetical protein